MLKFAKKPDPAFNAIVKSALECAIDNLKGELTCLKLQ